MSTDQLPIDDVKVILSEDRTFYPGELLSGHCQLNVNEPVVNCTSITVRVYGTAKISWSETFSTVERLNHAQSQLHTVWYIDSMEIVSVKQQIAIQNGNLQRGEHRFPFALQLKTE